MKKFTMTISGKEVNFIDYEDGTVLSENVFCEKCGEPLRYTEVIDKQKKCDDCDTIDIIDIPMKREIIINNYTLV